MNSIISTNKNVDGFEPSKFIHLLYAPTNFCNMGCQYCYLGTGTDELHQEDTIIDTLKHAVDSFLAIGTIPFNLSFHGGEATSIKKSTLESLFAYAKSHYDQYGAAIKQNGYPLNPIHIKTNLFNFASLYDLFDQYQVSISGSVDLPLFLHEKYRTDKKGRSTLKKITNSLHLLAKYPHHKKISCVITKEHFAHLDALIQDIKMIHYDIGLDMSKFNIMFSFDSEMNEDKFEGKVEGTEMLSQQEQVIVYNRLKQAFVGTDLEAGFQQHWFKEFTPEFCCSAVNCGDKFFLLQSNGDVYACPRGQSSKQFFYGNIFEQSVAQIQRNGWQTIESIENTLDADEDCFQCEYLPHCHQGCVYVREQGNLKKSYTCQLQKEIYRDNPERYPAFDESTIAEYAKTYRYQNNMKSFTDESLESEKPSYVTSELFEDENSLQQLISNDPILETIYRKHDICLDIDGVHFDCHSPILPNQSDIALLNPQSQVKLLISPQLLEVNCDHPVNNYIHLMLLRNTMVTYGDEQRTKQEHLADYSIYTQSLQAMSVLKNGLLSFDLSPFFLAHQSLFQPGIRNNLYITTKTLREYHYAKQKKNAFYHIQAINLPFSFIEFYWFEDSSEAEQQDNQAKIPITFYP